RSGAALGSTALLFALGYRAHKRFLETFEHFHPAKLRPLDRLIAPCRGEVETGVLQNEARAVAVRFESEGPPLSSPLSSRARRSLPLRRQSTPSGRKRSATWRLRRGSHPG